MKEFLREWAGPFGALSAIAIVVLLVMTTMMYMAKHKPPLPPNTEQAPEADKSRMKEVGEGRTSTYVPYVILRDTATGAEYLALRDGGIIKLEPPKDSK